MDGRGEEQWRETLAATGRTAAGMKAHDALIPELASRPGPISLGDAALDSGGDVAHLETGRLDQFDAVAG